MAKKTTAEQAWDELRETEGQAFAGIADADPVGPPEEPGVTAEPEKPRTETLLIPLDPNGTSDSVFLCVNGKSLLVRRGESVEVAPEFAEAYRNSQRQEVAAMRAKHAAASRA